MYVDISKPPAPLPTPQVVGKDESVSLIAPLSRRGHGPGLIILVPDTDKSLEIENGVPSLFVKWAEEGYTVVQIQEKALNGDAKDVLTKAIEKLFAAEKCTPKEAVGLVAYGSKLWNFAAPALSSTSHIVGAVVYANASEASSLQKAAIPALYHLAGPTAGKMERTDAVQVYEYPTRDSYSFAVPFQPQFHYSSEAVSHTRNLTFLKKLMNGPYFDLEAIWDEHTYFEFENRSVEHTMATMVAEPYVNHVPTMTGGIGRENLTNFYRNHFIFKNSADTGMELISRTVGIDRVIDEFIFSFTHDAEIDWLVPGIPPTGKKVEVPFMAVVNIRGDRLYHEHITWDSTSVLRQLGLMPEYLPYPYALPDRTKPAPGKTFEYKVPTAGAETASKMRDRNSLPSNEMFKFEVREV